MTDSVIQLGKLNQGEIVAVEFLRKYGLRVERFTAEEMSRSQTPDFRVFKGTDFVFYCEAKHLQEDDWLDKQLREAAPLQIVGGLRPDPIFNRISGRIHEAAKQFAAVNPEHKFPNVLVFTNSDRRCSFKDLVSVLTGNFYADNGSIEPIYAQYSEGRIKEEKLTIDLYVWHDEWEQREHLLYRFFYNQRSPYYAALCVLFNSDPQRHRKV